MLMDKKLFRNLVLFRCENLLLLETYSAKKGPDLELPAFLDIVQEVTDDSRYSMYYLSEK